jgi:WD40 repeat protein
VNLYYNDTIASFYLSFHDHVGPVTSIAFSRDSRKLLTGGMDGLVHQYSFDDSTGLIMLDTSFTFTKGRITKVFYGPGLRMVFASDDQNTLFAFDVEKRAFRNIKAPGPITTFAVSIDRMSFFIAVKGTSEIIQYDIMGKEKRRFVGHAGDITDMEVTVDRKRLISSSEDKTIKVWNLANGQVERSFSNHTWTINSICIDPYSKYVISCGLDGLVNVHEIESGELIASYKNDNGRCTDVAISTNLKYIIVGLQLKIKPSDEYGYGCNMWTTNLTPPRPKGKPKRPDKS